MLDEKLRAMERAALRAGRYLLETVPTVVASNKDFLTHADLRSESIIRRELAELFPDIPFFGEEGKDDKAAAVGEQWVVDPYDGTVNGFHGDDHWGVSIGLVRDGVSVAGAVSLPAKHQMFSTRMNGWTYLTEDGYEDTPTPVSISAHDKSSKPLVLLEWVKELHGGQDHERVIAVLARLDARFLYPQIRNASTASLMMVALGVAGGFVHLRPEPFDIAAACLIVEHAGGKVTDLTGNPWSPFSAKKGIVASNGVIHAELLEAVAGL